MNERFELRQIDGAPADQRVIGIVGDEKTVVAGVPYGTEEERRRAEMLVAAPDLLAALREAIAEREDRTSKGDPQVKRWRAVIAKAEGRS